MPSPSLTAQQTTALNNMISGLEDQQDADILTNGKYTHVPLVIDGDFTKAVFEYETPPNSFGYQIIIRYNDGSQEWIRHYGYGPEAVSRSKDWVEFDPTAI